MTSYRSCLYVFALVAGLFDAKLVCQSAEVSPSTTATDYANKNPYQPEQMRPFLAASKWTIFSLDPDQWIYDEGAFAPIPPPGAVAPSPAPKPPLRKPSPLGYFNGYPIIGSTTVDVTSPFKSIISDIDQAARAWSAGVTSFIPRHGIRVVEAGRTYDLVICYESGAAEVFQDGKEIGRMHFGSSQPTPHLLNLTLADAGVKLLPDWLAEIRNEIHPSSEQLKLLKEPSLAPPHNGAKNPAVRFILINPWKAPLAIRAYLTDNGPRLRIARMSGFGIDWGTLKTTEDVPLDRQRWDKLMQMIADEKVRNPLKTVDPKHREGLLPMKGPLWTLEVADASGYTVDKLWAPSAVIENTKERERLAMLSYRPGPFVAVCVQLMKWAGADLELLKWK